MSADIFPARQVSKEAAQVETDAKGSWHNGIAEAWSGWSPIVTGLKVL